MVRHGPLGIAPNGLALRPEPPGSCRVAGLSRAAGTPNSLADLDGHRGIFYTNRGVADWRFFGPDGATIVRGRAALRVNNGDVMRDAAFAGLGIALLRCFCRR